MWPTSVCARRIMRLVTSADVISSPTSRKNGTASRISESMPWNICPTIDCMLIGRQAAGHQHAGHQRERDRHAHVAENQKKAGHEQQDRAVGHLTIPAKSSASSGPSKPCRQPLMICSSENSTISAPAIGTLAV